MKFFLVFLSLVLFFIPVLAVAQNPLVPCGQDPNQRCELAHLFVLIKNVYDFIVLWIATPLAGLVIVIGGILILVSGGPGGVNPVTGIASPNLYNTGKNMVTGAVLGIFLIWGAWLIINTILRAIGYGGPI